MYAQRLEARPWFEAGTKLDGAKAFQLLKEQTVNHLSQQYCVYVHIPFCESICDFCALYTKAVRHDQTAVFDKYLETTISAIGAHPYNRTFWWWDTLTHWIGAFFTVGLCAA